MQAKGEFDVQLDPQNDEEAPAGRMVIKKEYSGDFVGVGTGQMLSKRTALGAAVYSAIEEVEGCLGEKKGAFTLVHSGYMTKEEQSLEIKIVPGSGDGDFKTISGSLEIIQEEGKHRYVLNYDI